MDNPFENKEVAQKYDGWYQSKVGLIYDYLEKKTISKLLNNKKRGKMLEVGSGTGHWSEYFTKLGFHVTGVEKSKYMVDIASKKKIENANFICEDIFDYETDIKFDCASFITSLEFIKNDEEAVKRVINFIKNEGFVLFGVLNKNSFLGKKRKEEKNVFTNARFYTQKEIKNLFGDYGTVSIQTCAYPSPKFINYFAVIEFFKKLLNFKNGNFIAGRVSL